MFKIGGKAVSEELEKLRYKQDAAERKLTKLRTKTVSEQDKKRRSDTALFCYPEATNSGF